MATDGLLQFLLDMIRLKEVHRILGWRIPSSSSRGVILSGGMFFGRLGGEYCLIEEVSSPRPTVGSPHKGQLGIADFSNIVVQSRRCGPLLMMMQARHEHV